MRLRRLLPAIAAIAAIAAIPALAESQSLDLMIDNYGLSIGDSRIVRGVRLNFRDREMQRVTGINATIWMPHKDARGGVVKGLALGLPATGADEIKGLGIGLFGVGAESEFKGLGVGGFGVGAGGDVTGILIGGFGVGAGGNVKGITIGGFGAGAGGDITGLTIGGFGAGAGGDVTGITIGGFGAGAGGTLKGLAIGIGGVGAPTVRGIGIAAAVGGHDLKGGFIAPGYFKVTANDDDMEGGRASGVSVSIFNHIKGDQFGLSIGLFNYAWEVNGIQLGVLNYVANNPKGTRLLPLINRSWKN